jgi:hypothetical protein
MLLMAKIENLFLDVDSRIILNASHNVREVVNGDVN